LIGAPGTQGRWTLIAHRDYYRLDPALPQAAAERDVYVVFSCATASQCSDLPGLVKNVRRRIDLFGSFSMDEAYSQSSANSGARVYRLRPSAAAQSG
jgi:hypothetical protein